MSEPVTIYECPNRHLSSHPVNAGGSDLDAPKCYACLKVVTSVRVFREEDVRPLWEAARMLDRERQYLLDSDTPYAEYAKLAAFPAPEEWTA